MDEFKWEIPTQKKEYSLSSAVAGDLICEKEILMQYVNKQETPPSKYLYVVDRFNKMVNCETGEAKEFDDKVYERLAHVLIKP